MMGREVVQDADPSPRGGSPRPISPLAPTGPRASFSVSAIPRPCSTARRSLWSALAADFLPFLRPWGSSDLRIHKGPVIGNWVMGIHFEACESTKRVKSNSSNTCLTREGAIGPRRKIARPTVGRDCG